MRANRGSALITALFIMTLVAIAATAMSMRLKLDIYRTRLSLSNDRLYLASQAVTFWAMDHLKNQTPAKNESKQALANFPSSLKNLYPEVVLQGQLFDLQALFNINNLQDRKFYPMFLKLLIQNLPKKDNELVISIIKAVIDWISPYQTGRGHDEYLSFYTSQKPPYVPGYQSFQSISELRLVKGMTLEQYTTLKPLLTVLPEITAINLNTAPKPLIMILGNGLSSQEADELLEAREKKNVTSINDLYPILKKLDIPLNQITLESTYFLCVSTASSDDMTLTLYTVMKRSKDKSGTFNVSIVSQSINTI